MHHRRIVEVREFGRVAEGGDEYPLLHAQTKGARTLLITAGFHGDETAGPLTLLGRLDEIVDHARARDVGLEIFPCLNPSGFTDGTRYNRSGERPNNDFLRYEIDAGKWAGELQPGQSFLRHELHREGPKETRAVRAELEALATPDAALDIHQDPWLGGEQTYAYTFGASDAYRPLVAASGSILSVARDTEVDDNVHTDADGLVRHHDGSITDWMFRRSVRFTAALETTTTSPLDHAHRVNLAWILGFIDLAAGV